MNLIPATILDNFLENPNEIRDWALSLDYSKSSSNGRYPGKRTKLLENINPPFHQYVTKKIISIFADPNKVIGESSSSFQLITNYEGNGWIHQDTDSQITAILYLSKESKINCGTSLYEIKSPNIFNLTPERKAYIKDRENHHSTGKIPSNILKQKNEFENNNFNKTLDIKDKFNRIFCFSSNHYHAANFFSPNNGEDRLTYISFIHNLHTLDGSPFFPTMRTQNISFR